MEAIRQDDTVAINYDFYKDNLTIVLVTSGSDSNPYMDVLLAVIASFSEYVSPVLSCRLEIIADGIRSIKKDSQVKSGRLTEEGAQNYEEYLDNIQFLIDNSFKEDMYIDELVNSKSQKPFIEENNPDEMATLASLLTNYELKNSSPSRSSSSSTPHHSPSPRSTPLHVLSPSTPTKTGRPKKLLYLKRLKSSLFRNARLTRLNEHHGFGHCVRIGVEMATTPLALIVQHDRRFQNNINLRDCLDIFMNDDGNNNNGNSDENKDMVNPKTYNDRNSNNGNNNYSEKNSDSNSSKQINYLGFPSTRFQYDRVNSLDQRVQLSPKISAKPLSFWYDSTHIVRISYLKNLFTTNLRAWLPLQKEFLQTMNHYAFLSQLKKLDRDFDLYSEDGLAREIRKKLHTTYLIPHHSFIEDTFGHTMRFDIQYIYNQKGVEEALKHHENRYGCYVLESCNPIIQHLDGRRRISKKDLANALKKSKKR